MERRDNKLKEEVQTFLNKHKDIIFKKWKELFYSSLGKESAKFFMREVDKFQNPIGHRVNEVFDGLLDSVFGDFDLDRVGYFIDKFMQLRAVQENTPSRALYPFLQLKRVLREEIGEDILKKYGVEEFLKIEDRVNTMIFIGFDCFWKYKERINQIRYDEWRRAHYLLLKRAGLVYDPLEGMIRLDEIDREETN